MKILENYYYRLDNSKDVSIVWKKYDKACVLELRTTYPTAIVDIDRLSGILITKEKLNQLGYLEGSENEFFLKDNRYSVCTNNNFDGWFICDGQTILRDFQFVHELQNLQFALTNNELIYKP
jgi:hypothetical protein